MLTHKDTCHISSFIPFRFLGHIIVNHFTVYRQVFETNVFHFPFFVIADNHGDFRILSRIRNVFEQDILNASAGCLAIFFVEEDTEIDQLSLSEVFYPDIFKAYVPYQVVVSGVDGKTALIIQLLFFMIQYIYIDIIQVFQNLRISTFPWIPMKMG